MSDMAASCRRTALQCAVDSKNAEAELVLRELMGLPQRRLVKIKGTSKGYTTEQPGGPVLNSGRMSPEPHARSMRLCISP